MMLPPSIAKHPARLLSVIVIAWLTIVLLTFADYGTNPDEAGHIVNGKAVVDWYSSGFVERTTFMWGDIWRYGGAYDVLCHAATSISPLPVHQTRHLLTALIGLVGILGTYALGKTIGSAWTGLLAAILLALTPRYYGHAFFNHKDIPFAVGYVWSVYLILRCYSFFPRVPARWIAACGLSIGLTLGLRVGGAILVFYLGIAVAYWFVERLRSRDLTLRDARDLGISVGVIALLGYLLMLAAWPWAQLEPFTRPLQALRAFSNYSFVVPTLFEGVYYPSSQIPWYYALKWLALTLPEPVLVGSLLGLAVGLRVMWRDRSGLQIGLIMFGLLFPLIYSAVKAVPFYNGMRHVIFALPMLAVLAAYGLQTVWKSIPTRRRFVLPIAVSIGLFMAHDLYAFHPNQVTQEVTLDIATEEVYS